MDSGGDGLAVVPVSPMLNEAVQFIFGFGCAVETEDHGEPPQLN
jgi:hypothetical protein